MGGRVTDRQIFAFSGVLDPRPGERGNLPLLEHVLELGRRRWLWEGPVRVCYLPTALGDDAAAIAVYQHVLGERDDVDLSVLRLFPKPEVPDLRKHLLRQDVVLVEGGSLVNLLAVWRAHGLPEVLGECWEEGIVLAGSGAGSQCWHAGAATDAWSGELEPFPDGLGLLPFSNAVHEDSVARRGRAAYRRMIAREELPAGYATEQGVGLHYVGGELAEAVTVRPGAKAWWVEQGGPRGWTQRAVETRPI
jgi:peptidase E